MKIQLNPLSQKSIENALREVQKYQNDFSTKHEQFIDRLVELAKEVIHRQVALAAITYTGDGRVESGSDTDHEITVVKEKSKGSMKATIRLSGSDVLFIEFGAGVSLNTSVGTSPNPKGAELGMTIGSYGQGLGKNKTWRYKDENGTTVLTRGTKATMPMFYAMEEIRQAIPLIAREVFGT